MIPGPVEVYEETLEAIAEPVRAHYGPEWARTYWEVVGLAKQVFRTQNDLFIWPSSGIGMIDATFGSMLYTGETLLVIANGSFAGIFQRVAQGYGLKVETVEFPWGQPADPEVVRACLREHPEVRLVAVVGNESSTGVVNPVKELAAVAHEFDLPLFVDGVSAISGVDMPVDEYGIDVCITTSNKGLEAPPGLGLISISPRAWEIIERKKADRYHGYYFNLSMWRETAYDPHWHDYQPYVVTMPTNNVMALRASVRRILQETLPVHFARLRWARDAVRAGLRNLGFILLAPEECASPTVTAVLTPEGLSADELLAYMREERGLALGAGLREMAGKGFRVGTMGKGATEEYLTDFLLGVEAFLRAKGVAVAEGASLVGLKTPAKAQ